MTGFESASTATLKVVERNLQTGLTLVADSLANGTFHEVGSKGAAPPAQSGHLTLALLAAVTAELDRREPHEDRHS